MTQRPKNDAPKVAACSAPGAVTLNYVRDGRPASAQITPRYDDARERYRLGVQFGNRFESIGAAGSASAALTGMWTVTTETVKAIGKLFYDSEARKEVSGVVGSYEVTRQSISIDPVLTLQLIAFISLSLAVVNLFPFLRSTAATSSGRSSRRPVAGAASPSRRWSERASSGSCSSRCSSPSD